MDFVRIASGLVTGQGAQGGGVLEKLHKRPRSHTTTQSSAHRDPASVKGDETQQLRVAGITPKELVGQGSIARVYRCALADDRAISVKVLRSHVKRQVACDARGIDTVASMASAVNPSAARAFRECAQLLQRETDLKRELKYGLLVADAVSRASCSAEVPVYLPELCTDTQLVYDFVAAQPLDTFDPHTLPSCVSSSVVDVYSMLLVCFGLCQCDLNTGNFLWNPTTQKLTMIDMGSVVRLTPETFALVREIHRTRGNKKEILDVIKHNAVSEMIWMQHKMLWAKKPVRFTAPMIDVALINYEMKPSFGFISRAALMLTQTLVHLGHFVQYFEVMEKNLQLMEKYVKETARSGSAGT